MESKARRFLTVAQLDTTRLTFHFSAGDPELNLHLPLLVGGGYIAT